MKENLGKVISGTVAICIIVMIGLVLNRIFSHGENIDMFIVWLIFAAEGIKNLFGGGWSIFIIVIGVISLIIWLVYFIVRAMCTEEVDNEDWDEKDEGKYKKWGKPCLKFGLAALVVAFFMQFIAAGIPNAKQAAVIYIVPKMINNVDMREIPPNLAKLVNEGLKEMIEYVKGDAKEAVSKAIDGAKGAIKDKVDEAAAAVKPNTEQKK
ncbi:MAG: hypothetical protein MUC28_04135 [Planctomycetes bacterium]|jgi:Na+/melibiose symporter-like transporter|nr:hypothetical protein [Planctomycetota bacterium]